jgi:hypothetical protein
MRAISAVAQSFAQTGHVHTKGAFVNHYVLPGPYQQIVLARHAPSPLD